MLKVSFLMIMFLEYYYDAPDYTVDSRPKALANLSQNTDSLIYKHHFINSYKSVNVSLK